MDRSSVLRPQEEGIDRGEEGPRATLPFHRRGIDRDVCLASSAACHLGASGAGSAQP